MIKVFNRCHYCKKFPSCNTLFPLCFVKRFAVIANNFFLPFLNLGQYRTHSYIFSIRVQVKKSSLVGYARIGALIKACFNASNDF